MTPTIPITAALQYAARGLHVFPVHETDGLAWCACGQPECRNPAKHPRNSNGFLGATTDPELINRWWRKWAKASVGIATGAVSGLWVLDVDPADGGQDRLADLTRQHGPLPATLTSSTGGGGTHYLFQHVPGWGCSTGKNHGFLGPGLDSRGDGGYIIAPPSLHISGGQYRWQDDAAALAPVPAWIHDLYGQHQRRAKQAAMRPHDVKPASQRAAAFDDAVRLYCRNNAREFPATGSPCGICPSPDGFKAHKLPGRWACFSSQHQAGGRRGQGHWWGDVLDLDASQRHRTRKQHLEAEGYWDTGARMAVVGGTTAPGGSTAPGAAALATVHQLHSVPQPAPAPPPQGLTKSFASLCEILETPDLSAGVLAGAVLRWDEMTGKVCLTTGGGTTGGGAASTCVNTPIQDVDHSRVRRAVELHHPDRDGHGLTFSEMDILKAMTLVASANPFHPVREYLTALRWDGIERLNSVAPDILNAAGTELNRVIVRKWMLSCVARALEPGCKVDTMLVLIGEQGTLKSTFFSVLAGRKEWFSDTPVNIRDAKETGERIRGIWICEWGELESLRRARDEDAVKTFLSSSSDLYRPAYGHHAIQVPRTAVFCGTTNRTEFLSDPTGNRRFWPLPCGEVDLKAAAAQRDQLWAEATAAVKAGEHHWLADAERHALDAVQQHHQVGDEWESLILPWVADRALPPTTADVMAGPLDLAPGNWHKPDQMRVAAILRRAGYVRTRDGSAGRPYRWERSSSH